MCCSPFLLLGTSTSSPCGARTQMGTSCEAVLRPAAFFHFSKKLPSCRIATMIKKKSDPKSCICH